MTNRTPILPTLVCLLAAAPLAAQEKIGAPTPSPSPPAALVNDQPIPEAAMQRALKRIPPANQAEARPELLDFLIDNTLIDQYLAANKYEADPKDLAARLKQVRDEIEKDGKNYQKVLQELLMSEDDMKAQIVGFLRWDRFVGVQATDKALREYFAAHKDMFDGSLVRARHILLTPANAEAATPEKAKARLDALKKQVEAQVGQGLAKLPAQTKPEDREKERRKLLDEAFARVARDISDCPSKAEGGDLQWFPRTGQMVEPFAKAAFGLNAYGLSDVVATRFGHHLILVTDRKPGKEVKYDDIKDAVKDVYGDLLREALLAQLRKNAKIVIAPKAAKS